MNDIYELGILELRRGFLLGHVCVGIAALFPVTWLTLNVFAPALLVVAGLVTSPNSPATTGMERMRPTPTCGKR